MCDALWKSGESLWLWPLEPLLPVDGARRLGHGGGRKATHAAVPPSAAVVWQELSLHIAYVLAASKQLRQEQIMKSVVCLGISMLSAC